MPHATEGDLHAYLDGALAAIDETAAERLATHLGRCADCRARLEHERVIRDRAGELLGAALPAVEPPPFETVVGSGGTRGSQRMTTERLAWAAAIIVALGAGWFGNAVLRDSPDSLVASRAETGPGFSETPVVEAREVAAEGEDGRAPALGLSAQLEEQFQNAPAGAEEVEPQPSAAKARATGSLDRSVDELEAREDVADDDAAGLERFGGLTVPQLQDVEAIAWREVDEAEATRWIGRAPLRVEALDVTAYETGELAGVQVVRVRQELPGGEEITLVLEVVDDARDDEDARDRRNEAASSLRAGARPEQEQPSPQSPSPADTDPNRKVERDQARRSLSILTMRSLVDGVWVTLQAPLALDSLRVLVSRIR